MGEYLLRKNPLLPDTWECKFYLQARIAPAKGPPIGNYMIREETIMYSSTLPITIQISKKYLDKANPEQLINYIQRQVQSVWTQAVAGMASKYTDLLIEALMPSIEQLLETKEWSFE